MLHTDEAGHCSGNRQGCLRGTRLDVLLQLERWLRDEQDHRVFWLNGLAGTGKSTIAQTFAEISFADGNLGASFRCSRDFEDRSNLRLIFPTLSFQLAYRYPRFREELLRVLRANPGVGWESLCSQMEKIIVRPLKATGIQTLIIIDALDECKDQEPASAILSILSRYVDKIPQVKFFITGRPEPRIRSGFRLESLRPITEVFRLHDVDRPSVDNDIKLFFKTQLADITKSRSDCDLMEDWPSSSDINILCKKSAGLFIYAVTIVKFIASKYHTPTERLTLITSLPQSSIYEGRLGINLLYTQVLEQAFCDVDFDEQELYSCFRSVVGMVVLVFNPLPMEGLSTLLRISDIHVTLRPLHSVFLVPSNMTDPIRVFHKSFPDFLTDPTRCKDERFFINPLVHHQEILLSCLSLMEERLKRNICDLDDYVSLAEVGDLSTHCQAQIGDTLEYACQFWVKHLVEIPSSGHNVEEVHKAVDKFFTTHLLFWIEVLSLTRNLDLGVHALNDIQQWYISVSCILVFYQNLCSYFIQAGLVCKWTNDSQRFILEYFNVISDSPSEIYHHALPFSPSSSWFHEYYSSELLQEVKVVKGLCAEWGTCSCTVFFDRPPEALTCWKDTVAASLCFGDIVILDAITGVYMSILSGHTDRAGSLAFSLDGTFLVSGSNDKTANLWDIQTGGVIKAFCGHTSQVCSVSISPDCSMVASACQNDNQIYLWDVWTGECHCTIAGHSDDVSSVSFSPINSQLLMSASYDCSVRQWDVDGNQVGSTYSGDHVAFCLDGACFVSWQEKVATIWSTNSGVIVAELQAPNDSFGVCCFSPDGKFLAGSAGSTIYVWIITNSGSHLVETFIGHTRPITSITFSSSLISASYGGSMRFWQVRTTSTDPQITPSLDPSPPSSAPIESISLQSTDGIAISSDLAGVVAIWDISTGLCKASFHTPAKGICWRDAWLVDDILVFIWYIDGKIHIWNTEKGKYIQIVDVPSDSQAMRLRILGGGSKVFLLYQKSIQAWSIWTGEAVGAVRLEVEPLFDSFVVDGSRVWVCSKDSQTWGWDFSFPGSTPILLPDILPGRHLKFINGNDSESTGPSRIENTVTGKEVFRLPSRYAKPSTKQWDGQYLVAGYGSGEVLILDLKHMISQKEFLV